MYSCAALVGVNGHAHTRQASPQYRKGWYRMAAKHSLESLEGVYAQKFARATLPDFRDSYTPHVIMCTSYTCVCVCARVAYVIRVCVCVCARVHVCVAWYSHMQMVCL